MSSEIEEKILEQLKNISTKLLEHDKNFEKTDLKIDYTYKEIIKLGLKNA